MLKKLLFLLGVLLLAVPGWAVQYDGIWFLGANLERPVFQQENSIKIRKAIFQAINQKYLAETCMESSCTPDSYFPKGMLGYHAIDFFHSYAPEEAKQALSERAITVSILYTDGKKTSKIAHKIKADLEAVGVQVVLVSENYVVPGAFEKVLAKGDYDFFLMGYKAQSASSVELLENLYAPGGSAHFFRIPETAFDQLVQKAMVTTNIYAYDRVQEYLWENAVLLPIFYIEKF